MCDAFVDKGSLELISEVHRHMRSQDEKLSSDPESLYPSYDTGRLTKTRRFHNQVCHGLILQAVQATLNLVQRLARRIDCPSLQGQLDGQCQFNFVEIRRTPIDRFANLTTGAYSWFLLHECLQEITGCKPIALLRAPRPSIEHHHVEPRVIPRNNPNR